MALRRCLIKQLQITLNQNMIGFVVFVLLRKYILNKHSIDGTLNLLNWKYQSRYQSKVGYIVKESHLFLSTMTTARKVTPSNDPVECVDPDLPFGDMLICLQRMAYMPLKKGSGSYNFCT